MRASASLAALVLALAGVPARAADLPRIDVQEITLGNGMRFLILERHDAPTIAAGWVAHVGSSNEREGITGISHLFEHMMFKGTRTIGTKDAAADEALIAEQETLRDAMRAEQSTARARARRGEVADAFAPAAQTPRYRELEQQFQALVLKQRETQVKDELDAIYTRNGAERLNAQTDEDATLYYVQLPSNRLELWAWLESDRLADPVFREFYSEREVVREERRRSVESTPLGPYEEAWNALFWEASPYRWPVLGWPSDLQSITKVQADEYFARYYAPNNLTGVIVGDVRVADARPLLERYFGRLKRRPAPPEVVTDEPLAQGEKRYHAVADTSSTVRVWWHGVPFLHKDRAALDLLSDLLSGRTGRLYKSLVLGKGLANSAGASIDLRRFAGVFEVEVLAKDGADPAAILAALDAEIARVQQDAVPAEELQKLKNQAKADAYRRLSSPFAIMVQLLAYDGLGDWRYINDAAAETDAVTAADLQRVARAYLTQDGRSIGVFERKAAAAAASEVHP
jgi:predicted Zn-dependent peptidase